MRYCTKVYLLEKSTALHCRIYPILYWYVTVVLLILLYFVYWLAENEIEDAEGK